MPSRVIFSHPEMSSRLSDVLRSTARRTSEGRAEEGGAFSFAASSFLSAAGRDDVLAFFDLGAAPSLSLPSCSRLPAFVALSLAFFASCFASRAAFAALAASSAAARFSGVSFTTRPDAIAIHSSHFLFQP